MSGTGEPTTQPLSDTGAGLLVGGQPAQRVPPVVLDQQGVPLQPQQVSQPPQAPPFQQQQPNGQPQYRWTDEDIERARQQEKDKLYGRINELGTQMQQFQAEREAEQAERTRLAQEAADALRSKEEGEMEVRDLMTRRETEWQERFTQLESRYDSDRAIFEKERAFTEVQNYRRDRIEQEEENILPELRDLISGDTAEAVDASIEVMKARTAQIFANMAAAQQQLPFQQPRGSAPTLPPVGPMEQMPSYESLTPDDIRNMDMETYKRYRAQLLQATNPNRGRGR